MGAGGIPAVDDRRRREAQREAVQRVLPLGDGVSVLRTASGEVLVYGEQADKRRPVVLRAVVMPDGHVEQFETRRFRRR